MAKQASKKKPTALAKAKAEVAELKEKLASLNVDLSDNIVTHDELQVLKVYKYVTFVLAGLLLIVGFFAIF